MNPAPNREPVAEGQLGLFDAISIIVGIVIGTTVFAMAGLIFANCVDPIWGVAVWALGGVMALIGAFCYAELATTYPRAGGDYFYLSRAYGSGTGFLFGWAQLAVIMPASIGLMAYVFSDYLQQAFFSDQPLHLEVPLGDKALVLDPHFAIAGLAVLVLTITNILGVIVGKTVQNLLALAKLAGLVAIIVVGFCWPAQNAWEYTVKPEGTPLLGTLAILFVMFAYGGWNDAAFVAAEVRDPRRNIPRALIWGVGIITVVYVLVNAAYINNVGWDRITQPESLPASVMTSALGEHGGQAMRILVMISALGAVNGLIFAYARVLAALGADHRLFGWMGYWRPGHGSPIMALLLQAVLTIFILWALTTKEGHGSINDGLGYVNKGFDTVNRQLEERGLDRHIPPIDVGPDWKPRTGFDNLLARTAPVFWIFFLLAGLSLFILREKDRTLIRPYSVPLYPIVPLIFCNFCAWMLYQAVDYVKWHALFAVVLVLIGVPLYWFSLLISGSKPSGPVDLGVTPVQSEPTLYRSRPPLR
jgi:amino acid transporter